MIDPILQKYVGKPGLLLAAMLGAADCGHRYSLECLSRLTGLTPKQIGRNFATIREMGFKIRRRRLNNIPGHTYEYLIERRNDAPK